MNLSRSARRDPAGASVSDQGGTLKYIPSAYSVKLSIPQLLQGARMRDEEQDIHLNSLLAKSTAAGEH